MDRLPSYSHSRAARAKRIAVLTFLAGIVLPAVLPLSGANASTGRIYWVVYTDTMNNIGFSELDGTNATANYISGIENSDLGDGGLIVRDQYVYWTSRNKILRSKKDGTGAIETVYFDTNNLNVHGLAMDSNYLYWSSDGGSTNLTRTGAIGRANLDGSAPNPTFIQGTSLNTTRADVEGNSLFVTEHYIYWTNYWNGTIGRADINGQNIDRSFIVDDAGYPWTVWVTDTYIYWTGAYDVTIGRANLDGTGKNASFISTGAGNTPYGLTVTDEHIYWTTGSGKIGRALVSGESPVRDFVNLGLGVGEFLGLAIDFSAPIPISAPSVDPVSTAKAAEEARAREVVSAKAEIKSALSSGKLLTADQLSKADIGGVTSKNIDLVNADIAQLPEDQKTEIAAIEKVVLKFATVDKVAEGKSFYSTDLIAVGLIPQDSKIKTSILSAIKKLPGSDLDTYEKIQAVVAKVEKQAADRKERLAAILAKKR